MSESFEADLVLSDVHLHRNKNSPNKDVEGNKIYLTGFTMKCPNSLIQDLCKRVRNNNSEGTAQSLQHDDDGDLILDRGTDFSGLDIESGTVTLNIYHSMATRLGEVGLQVWMGALAMIDYILHNADDFKDRSVLELGGGVGLTSLVVGMIAKSVVITDIGESILNVCKRNYEENVKFLGCRDRSFEITELDWFKTNPEVNLIGTLSNAECILACDVIYDNDITDAFFRTLYHILNSSQDLSSTPKRTVIIALEKRLNFTLIDLDVMCKEYDHFRDCLSQLQSTVPALAVERIDLKNITQHCDYTRTQQLEVWKLQQQSSSTTPHDQKQTES